MRRNLSYLPSLVLMLILSISCSAPATTMATATPESLITWWTLWLDQPACKAPCWQTITPGKTSMKDAVEILENTQDVIITYKGEYGVSWQFSQTRTGSGDMRESEDGIVSSIRLGDSPDKDLHFKTIVEEYGYPSFVELYDCQLGMCSTILVYPDIGLLVDTYLEDNMEGVNPSQVTVQPDVVVSGVYFIPPGLENFKKKPEFQEQDLLEWKGYGEYP